LWDFVGLLLDDVRGVVGECVERPCCGEALGVLLLLLLPLFPSARGVVSLLAVDPDLETLCLPPEVPILGVIVGAVVAGVVDIVAVCLSVPCLLLPLCLLLSLPLRPLRSLSLCRRAVPGECGAAEEDGCGGTRVGLSGEDWIEFGFMPRGPKGALAPGVVPGTVKLPPIGAPLPRTMRSPLEE